MSISKVASTQYYQGLSTEAKPMDVIGGDTIPPGSVFHSVDTGDEGVYYEGMWTLDLRKAMALKRSLLI